LDDSPEKLTKEVSPENGNIGFTDFEEGSKSEIFRRCDAGASNENAPNPQEFQFAQMNAYFKMLRKYLGV